FNLGVRHLSAGFPGVRHLGVGHLGIGYLGDGSFADRLFRRVVGSLADHHIALIGSGSGRQGTVLARAAVAAATTTAPAPPAARLCAVRTVLAIGSFALAAGFGVAFCVRLVGHGVSRFDALTVLTALLAIAPTAPSTAAATAALAVLVAAGLGLRGL